MGELQCEDRRIMLRSRSDHKMMAACIEGVVVHELNHLLEKGHTRRFHDLMAHWVPDYKERQKILSRSPREFI